MAKRIFQQHQRPIIKVVGGPPDCPLCGNKMREVLMGKHTIYVCTRELCMISINKNDPCIQRWDMIEKPLCTLCKSPMKVFVRKDKLVIMQCCDKRHRPYQVTRGDARALPPLSND